MGGPQQIFVSADVMHKCLHGRTFFLVDALIFSAHSQRLPSILNSTAPEHKQPQVKVQDCKWPQGALGTNTPFPCSMGGA